MGRRLSILAIPLSLLVLGTLLLPPPDYLPQGNRNLIFWLSETLPGTSVDEALALSEQPRAFLKEQKDVQNVFFANSPRFQVMGIVLKPQYANGKGLDALVDRLIPQGGQYPGYRFMFPIRLSIFRDPGKEFEVRMSGSELSELEGLERQLRPQLQALSGVKKVRSDYVSGAPQLDVIPNRVQLAGLGLSASDAGAIVEAALGGSKASDFVEGAEELDVTVKLQNTAVKNPRRSAPVGPLQPHGSAVATGRCGSSPGYHWPLCG